MLRLGKKGSDLSSDRLVTLLMGYLLELLLFVTVDIRSPLKQQLGEQQPPKLATPRRVSHQLSRRMGGTGY